MAKRQYSDNERATALAALDANAGNVSKTAKQLKIPRKTLELWSQGHIHPDVAIIRLDKKVDLSERLIEVAHLLLDSIPSKLKDASLLQIATSLGIAIDKAQLLSNKPTDRTEHTTHVEISVENRANRIMELLDAARTRRNGLPTGSAIETAND